VETLTLPRGTVSFLFTDIERSTRRWQDDPSMSDTLARHDTILRDAVEAHGGHVLKHTGDGAVAVFRAASDAVCAAVDAQRGLREAHWEGESLGVRMAVHTGEAEHRDGDYFGPTLNVAARLVAAGHGGQILLSLSSEELARDRLHGDLSVVDLGEHFLRDLDHPERVFQVVGRGLRETFPPLSTRPRSTGARVRTNLPAPRTTFVGREVDIAKLIERLGAGRFVTLIGVGGAGKTRLAVEVGRQVAEAESEDYHDGVAFADLSSLAEGTAVARTVAEALGVQPALGSMGAVAVGSAEEKVVAFLRDRRVLLVLDNCEHLLDTCAALVDKLLSASPGLALLATSREALAVEGEQVWQVGSLSLPAADSSSVDDAEAMRLLVDRIRAVRPDFEVGDENRGALVEICVHLDGIPLALELAAVRIAHLSPEDVARRLGDRFTLLTGGRRRTQRQQTLQATIDWSYDLLEAREQTLLRRLAVFSGGFPLEAVEGTCMGGIDGSAVDLLGSLIDKSLVVADVVGNQTRYSLLETIRLYAENKLREAGESEPIRAAHRDWYLHRLEEEPWDRSFLSDELARKTRLDLDNILNAMAWSDAEGRIDLLRRLLLRIGTLFWRTGTFDAFDEARPWIDRVLDYEQSALPPGERFTHVLVELIVQLAYSGDVPTAEAGLRRVEALTEGLADGEPITALAHITHATLLAAFPARVDELRRSGALAAEHAGTTYPLMRAWALWFQATAHLYERRYDEAAGVLQGIRGSSDEYSEADAEVYIVRSGLALVRHLQGRHADARRILEAARSGPDGDLAFDPVFSQTLTAVTEAAVGDLGAARRRMRNVVTSVRTSAWTYHPLARSDCLGGLAVVAALEGEVERASRLIAAIPNMATGTVPMWVLLRHYRDLVRDQLDPATRRRCIDEGRAMRVDDAIDDELARWHRQEMAPPGEQSSDLNR
jgi:predicted ATPase/class 3 adenylate cyclase